MHLIKVLRSERNKTKPQLAESKMATFRSALTLCGIVLSITTCVVVGRENGAPLSACSSMTPGHGTQQSGDSYTLNIGAVTNYTAGTEVRVTVSGAAFQGIIIQARNGDGDIIGTFQDPGSDSNLKLLACGGVEGSAITHSSATAKTNPELVWIPPATASGNVNFIATVATNPATWWRNVISTSLVPDYDQDTGVTDPDTSSTSPDADTTADPGTGQDPVSTTPTSRANPHPGVAGSLVVVALISFFLKML